MAHLPTSPGSSLLPPVNAVFELSPASSLAGTKRKREPSQSSPPPSSFISIPSGSEDDDEGPVLGQWSIDLSKSPKTISRQDALPRLQEPPNVDAVRQDTHPGQRAEMQFDAEVERETRLAVDDEMSRHRQANQQSGPEPDLCPEQIHLLDLIASGRNVFYTGSAGCGKSTVLKAAVKMLQDMGKRVHILAPTGRAALQVDGMSTWSYMGWTPAFHKKPLEELINEGFRKFIKQRWRKTDVLIIDEISMVENHHLERMNLCMKAVRCWQDRHNAPAFGGVQLIVTGDFCQLPPVNPFQFCMECGLEMPDNRGRFNCPQNHGPFLEEDKWAFKSSAWEEAKLEHVHLRQIHRQNDEYFIKLLQKCRLGLSFKPDEIDTLMDHPCNIIKATQLYCTRKEVAQVNTQNFNRLKTPIFEYKALDGFKWNRGQHPHLSYYNERETDGTLKKCQEHRLEPLVRLRGGMLVVLQVNLDIKGGLVNGSQGIICGFEPYDPSLLPKAKNKENEDLLPPWQTLTGEHAKLRETQIAEFMKRQTGKVWPKVLFHNGKKRTIYASCVVNSIGDREPYSLLHRTQIPLVAGWAMSVHKSQGMTLDRVIVNLSRAFEEGQVYVALSRATSLDGLKIEGGSEGLSAVCGGNQDVSEFLASKFGLEIFNL